MATVTTISSDLQSIEQISNSDVSFNIPLYQRLYVWSDEQIDILLEDVMEACKAEKDLFYLGGILIVKSDKEPHLYDLIDGQQRFTTLWLISLELGHDLIPFKAVDGDLRLKFSIRKKVTEYFSNVNRNKDFKEDDIVNQNSSLSRIKNARARINRFINEVLPKAEITTNEFASFIYKNLKLIVTEVPVHTDLNKLFEVSNNRGVQLQHHEILKAAILKKIRNKDERARYAKIWDSCAEMSNYIEKNLSAEVGKNVGNAFNKDEKWFDLDALFNLMTSTDDKYDSGIMDLNSILSLKNKDLSIANSKVFEAENPEADDTEDQPVRSILSFPQLLLHTLRIYLIYWGDEDIPKISEKELLYTFKNHSGIQNEINAKDFISLLLDVRTVFDSFIIKWVTMGENEEEHQIKSIRKYKQKQTNYLQRQKPSTEDSFALLQSMLYHSQQITTHYWLTPILLNALNIKDTPNLFNSLRKYDDILFCSEDDRTLPVRTWELMLAIEKNEEIQQKCNINILDRADLGVGFPHYWFYKLEFVLWYKLKDQIPEWKNFRMTAKNSVEHVSPQNPEFKADIVSDENLNSFGNLALVSRSLNSEMSNKPYREKRERMRYKNGERVDSLKLYMIFKSGEWNDDNCNSHLESMKSIFQEYLNN